jgi:RimJ/RimL family protein N-acetyltransferase
MELTVPEIETTRLRLRAFAPADFDAFAAMRADPEVMRYIGTGEPQDRARSEAWLGKNEQRWRRNGFGMWAAEHKELGRVIGWCGLVFLDETPEVEVGYGFARDFWGRGLATEAARRSLRFGFEGMGLGRIVAIAQPENVASRRVMEKLGMRYERPAHYYGADVAYYSITRGEFRRAGQVKGENLMSETDVPGGPFKDEVDPSEMSSPSEKLEGQAPAGSPVPGAQNPASEEIKEEQNPNTE